MTLQMAIKKFVDIDTMGKSNETRDWYEKRLSLFAKSIGTETAITSISETDLLNWYRNLEKSKLATDTRHGYIRAVRKLFKFLHNRNVLPINLAQDLKLPKLSKHARKGISDKDTVAILDAAKGDKRDYALLLFLESTNARREGIANLRISDLSLDLPEPLCRQVRLSEKGDRDRVAVMSRDTLKAMRQWLAVRESKSDFVFIAKNKDTKLKATGVSEILDRYKARIKLQGRCSPHQWRHRWCRKRLQDGMPLAQVSQLAGHTSIVVTSDYYGTFASSELQDAFDKYYKPPILTE